MYCTINDIKRSIYEDIRQTIKKLLQVSSTCTIIMQHPEVKWAQRSSETEAEKLVKGLCVLHA